MEPGRASETARRVAAQRLTFPRVAGAGRAEDDEALHRDVADGVDVGPESPMRRYLAARTAFFDRVVTGWSGSQVVSLGAGYDGRALRYTGPQWWEVDHPDTQSDKRRRLARLGISSDVVFVATDLLTDELVLPGHDAQEPTLFLCEGVLAYLPLATAARVLTAAAVLAASGSLLAVEIAVEPLGEASTVRRQVRDTVSQLGEQMSEPWSRSALTSRLGEYGWELVSAVDARGAVVEASALTAALVVAGKP